MFDNDPPPTEPESRRLPPLTFCHHCGKRSTTWACRQCDLCLCEVHLTCPECDSPRR
jgi:hypothetical protein